MKILILGMLGSGKSTLAYHLSHYYHLPRLNLDEVARHPKTGEYYSVKEQQKTVDDFLLNHKSWVMEGCQKSLYSRTKPDIIVIMNVSRAMAVFRFTLRFFKAKRLIGKTIEADLPVQAYHYRKFSFSKILDWDKCNKKIKAEIIDFSKNKLVISVKEKKDYIKVEKMIFKQ